MDHNTSKFFLKLEKGYRNWTECCIIIPTVVLLLIVLVSFLGTLQRSNPTSLVDFKHTEEQAKEFKELVKVAMVDNSLHKSIEYASGVLGLERVKNTSTFGSNLMSPISLFFGCICLCVMLLPSFFAILDTIMYAIEERIRIKREYEEQLREKSLDLIDWQIKNKS